MVENLDHDSGHRECQQNYDNDIENGNEIGLVRIAEEHFGQERDTENTEDAHAGKENSTEHIEGHADPIEHDKSGKGNDEGRDFLIMFSEILRLEIGKYPRALDGKNQNDGAWECSRKYG